MSLEHTLEMLKGKLEKVSQNKVAPFSYEQEAYINDTVDGTTDYDFSNAQNIPTSDANVLQVNPTILAKGFRSQVSSLPRMLLNHFFGRTSYNLNKAVDHLLFLTESISTSLGESEGIATLDVNKKLIKTQFPYQADVEIPFLDSNKKLKKEQIPQGVLLFNGFYNAQTNEPPLVNGTGVTGSAYCVSVEGRQAFGGNYTYVLKQNMFILYNGEKWTPLAVGGNIETDVVSVNGKLPDSLGNVVLYGTDILTKDEAGENSLAIEIENFQDLIGNLNETINNLKEDINILKSSIGSMYSKVIQYDICLYIKGFIYHQGVSDMYMYVKAYDLVTNQFIPSSTLTKEYIKDKTFIIVASDDAWLQTQPSDSYTIGEEFFLSRVHIIAAKHEQAFNNTPFYYNNTITQYNKLKDDANIQGLEIGVLGRRTDSFGNISFARHCMIKRKTIYYIEIVNAVETRFNVTNLQDLNKLFTVNNRAGFVKSFLQKNEHNTNTILQFFTDTNFEIDYSLDFPIFYSHYYINGYFSHFGESNICYKKGNSGNKYFLVEEPFRFYFHSSNKFAPRTLLTPNDDSINYDSFNGYYFTSPLIATTLPTEGLISHSENYEYRAATYSTRIYSNLCIRTLSLGMSIEHKSTRQITQVYLKIGSEGYRPNLHFTLKAFPYGGCQ